MLYKYSVYHLPTRQTIPDKVTPTKYDKLNLTKLELFHVSKENTRVDSQSREVILQWSGLVQSGIYVFGIFVST